MVDIRSAVIKACVYLRLQQHENIAQMPDKTFQSNKRNSTDHFNLCSSVKHHIYMGTSLDDKIKVKAKEGTESHPQLVKTSFDFSNALVVSVGPVGGFLQNCILN